MFPDMNTKIYLLALLVVGMVSCRKDKQYQPNPVFPNPGNKTFIDLKLKEINIRSLPSPYYHFDYSDATHISSYNFSSGLMIYDMQYSGTKLSSMKNTTFMGNRDNVEYKYTGDALTTVNVTSEAGVLYRRGTFSYNASGQLVKLEWEVKNGSQPLEKEHSFELSYYTDGNVKEVTQHFFPVGPQTDMTYKDTYENYDDKLNVDGFSIIHISQFKHPVLMTNALLQVNNAKKVTHTGDGINYKVDYTYTYDPMGRPLIKNGDLVMTNGADAGKHFDLQTTYSYHN
jgi:hypothetical protein